MDYIFYGPYWVFCLLRAGMTASFGETNYGSFDGIEGLFLGFFIALAWFFAVSGILLLMGESVE